MPTGSPILQSGTVTPGHLVAFVTDGVAGDAGVALPNLNAMLSVVVKNVNFNLGNTDNPISIGLPANFLRYRIHDIIISGASASCSLATCGVFTQAGGLGTAIVAGGTAVTVSSTVPDAPNTMQVLTIINQNIVAFVDSVIYFRVQGAQGTPATANVTVNYEPLP
jgi:hypothetical protein